jgi:hypothetical protein
MNKVLPSGAMEIAEGLTPVATPLPTCETAPLFSLMLKELTI